MWQRSPGGGEASGGMVAHDLVNGVAGDSLTG